MKKREEVKLTVGELHITVKRNGDIHCDGQLELTAKDLDRIAARIELGSGVSKLADALIKRRDAIELPGCTANNGYEVIVDDALDELEDFLREREPSVEIGCQRIDAKSVRRVHTISRAMRSRTAKK